jgi:hypothetical protein
MLDIPNPPHALAVNARLESFLLYFPFEGVMGSLVLHCATAVATFT